MPLVSPIHIRPARCRAGTILPLTPVGQIRALVETGYLPSHQPSHLLEGPPARLPVGTMLGSLDQPEYPCLQVVGRVYVPGLPQPCPLLRSLTNWVSSNVQASSDFENAVSDYFYSLPVSRTGYAMACITLSDRGFVGRREDLSGPAMAALVQPVLSLCHQQRFLLPDDAHAIRALVPELALGQGYDLILTTGGTGLAPRDVTPEAVIPLLDRRLPGFEQRMMHTSLKITPHAALARCVAGTIGETLILSLPGSVKAATENLGAILQALPHALEKLKGDSGDCGG